MRQTDGLPTGAATTWLALREGRPVAERALLQLQAQPHLDTPALRQYARDLAGTLAATARRSQTDLAGRFAGLHRTGDLALLQHSLAELIDTTLRDDRLRATLDVNGLTASAARTLLALAEKDLARPGLRSGGHGS